MSDPAALAATHALAFAGGETWSAATFAALMAAPGVMLAGDARAFVLGRVILDEAEILTLATRPDLRRRGLARQALARFETLAAGAGARAVFLEVDAGNGAARALYAQAGYAAAGLRRGYYRHAAGPPGDAVVLRKSLPRRPDSGPARAPGADSG